jgi:hypothetical protein
MMTKLAMRRAHRAWTPRWLGLALASAVSAASAASAQMKVVELPGAADHPLVSRYAGSVLHTVSQPIFQQMLMPLGAGLIPIPANPGAEYKDKLLVEGTLTGHFYVVPKERSALGKVCTTHPLVCSTSRREAGGGRFAQSTGFNPRFAAR